MTQRDKMGQTAQDIVPAWLQTLTCNNGEESNKVWQGELYLCGRVQPFIASDDVIDNGLKGHIDNTPVLTGFKIHQTETDITPDAGNKQTESDKADVLTLTELSLMKPGVPLAVAESLFQAGTLTNDLNIKIEQLIGIIASLNRPLRELLSNLFTNTDIATGFVTNPASHKHHHAQAGGLLHHSVDCALMVKQLAAMRMSVREAEVTTVAALLHDIGKTQTHQDTLPQNVMGHCVPHESAGIELLAPYLKELDTHWHTGATLLRHMLGRDRAGHRFPAFPGTLLIKMCDQFDTALDLRTQSFEGKPGWYGYTHTKGIRGQRFLRIPS